MPITLTPRFWKSGARRATSANSVVQTGLLSIARQVRDPGYGINEENMRKIARVREEDSPTVTDPFVEFDRTSGGLRLEVGCDTPKTKRSHC